jgi:putative chitinase
MMARPRFLGSAAMSMFGFAGSAPATAQPLAPSVTEDKLRRLAAGATPAIIAGIAADFDRLAPEYAVTTRLRLCHFLAQAAHETDSFRTLEEYGGPAYFARYEGRRDLGNTQPGDGARFHGRGVFQLTGRFNYHRLGKLIGVDLEADPELAKQPDISLAIAFAYWREREINAAADADDVLRVTKLINGGRNGLAERTRLLAVAKTIWL